MTTEFYALKTLLDQNITSFPIDWGVIKRILISEKWELVPFRNDETILRDLLPLGFTEIPSSIAFSICLDGLKQIYFNENLSATERVAAVAHEIGHIKLEHITDTGILGKSTDSALNALQEQEANDFARELLAPVCILRNLGVKTISDIQKITNISTEDAHTQLGKIYENTFVTEEEMRLIRKFNRQILRLRLYKHWKGILFVFFSSFLLLLSFMPAENSIQEEVAFPTTTTRLSLNTTSITVPSHDHNEMVAVTKSGEKYHKPNCFYVKNKQHILFVTAQEAIQCGYTPCLVCCPDPE